MMEHYERNEMSDEEFEKWWSGLPPGNAGSHRKIVDYFCAQEPAREIWRASKQAHSNEWQPISGIMCDGRALVEVYESRNPCLIVIKHADQVCVSDKWTHWRYHTPPKPKEAWEKAWEMLKAGDDPGYRAVKGYFVNRDQFREIFNIGREAK